jgi:hypothetical protein
VRLSTHNNLYGPEMAEQRRKTRERLKRGKPRVYEALQRSGFKLKEVGERSGVGKEIIRRALYGRGVSFRMARALARVLGAGLAESEMRALERSCATPHETISEKFLKKFNRGV